MQQKKLSLWLLRFSLVSVFSYAAIASFLQPQNWIGYFPPFLVHLIPAQILLSIFSVYELLLSLWILTGWKNFWSALLAGTTLFGIIFANFSDIDILFRDFAIFFAALALAVQTYKK